MNVLITGAAGYIASHCITDLIKNNLNIIGVDNFYNSSPKALDKITEVTRREIQFYEGDLRDIHLLDKIFKENKIDAVIHFGGLKSNTESISKPDEYYDVNINSTKNILKCMEKYNTKYIIFSGSATVYGDTDKCPIVEEDVIPPRILSPYGMTKYQNELILKEFVDTHPGYKAIVLRYFNPVGAHPSGILGECVKDNVPNCLFPYVCDVALGKLPYLKVFGNKYPTVDGTGVRDYIHVMDLASGHLAALSYIQTMKQSFDVFNLGTGKGTSVLELIHAFERVNGIKIPYQIVDNRPGDMPISYACADKANKILNWKAKYTIDDCVRDAWNFIRRLYH